MKERIERERERERENVLIPEVIVDVKPRRVREAALRLVVAIAKVVAVARRRKGEAKRVVGGR